MLGSSTFEDENYLRLLVCGSHHFFVYHLCCWTHELSFLCSVIWFFRRWCDGWYITFKCLSSWMLGFLPYHTKWGDVLSNALFILNLWTSADVSAAHQRFITLITINKVFSYHNMYDYVVSFILAIETRCITTGRFHGCFEFSNK